MKFIIKQAGIILILTLAQLTAVFADQTEELLKIMNQAMLEPCNSQPYLACLGLQQAFCRRQVGLSVDFCHKKFPMKQATGDQQRFFERFGLCMQTEIIGRLKLNEAVLNKCEPVLQSYQPNG